MGASRLDLLSSIVKQNPNDLLARYGLAMEYVQQGDYPNALEHFRALMVSKPDSVEAYYQAGRLLQKIGELRKAREVFGMELRLAIEPVIFTPEVSWKLRCRSYRLSGRVG